MSTTYDRRVEQEWRLLGALAEANPDVVGSGSRRASENGVAFDFDLFKTGALIETLDGVTLQETHRVTVHFPRFFPSIPLEASLDRPVFHPNVNPETGFVCLWGRFSPGDTIVEAVAQLQRVISWELVNRETDHLMQPKALLWLGNAGRRRSIPLPFWQVRKPHGFVETQNYRNPSVSLRRRLS